MFTALYNGSTGLRSLGEGMGVITNNLSNVNTVGFKQKMLLYEDLFSSTLAAAGSNNLTNISQKGHGVRPSTSKTLFTQGGFEPGSAATDMAIQGMGFFGVLHKGQMHYTRAGNFRFTKDGELLDPNGWNLVGRPIVHGKMGPAPEPIKLDMSHAEGGAGYMPGQASNWVKASAQLGGLSHKNPDSPQPFFSMASLWDGTATPPLRQNAYSYADPFTFYDAEGNRQTASIYYNLVEKEKGMKIMEYVVAMDPALDASSRAGTQSAGLLMAGTLSFDEAGSLRNLSAFSPPASGDPAALRDWAPATINADGLPETTVSTPVGTHSLAIDMGFVLPQNAFSMFTSAQSLEDDPGLIYSPTQGAKAQSYVSTAYGSTIGSKFHQTDGYTSGYLRDLQVLADGTIVGMYSNNQSQDLYKVSLYRFTSQDGLRQEGHNHYSATKESGEAQEGLPSTQNFGKIAQRSLEQSNVDYAREFASMIITQRGFQMNSKVVTTSDQMLQKALELKR